MIEILYKKLNPNAKIERKHEGDAGWDIVATERITVLNCIKYKTGLAFAVPKGHWLMMAPRSSIYKTGLMMSNSMGVIDSGYRGEVMALFYRASEFGQIYEAGDRIAQIIVMPDKVDEVKFVEVDELPESEDGRGEGGFGSTGK